MLVYAPIILQQSVMPSILPLKVDTMTDALFQLSSNQLTTTTIQTTTANLSLLWTAITLIFLSGVVFLYLELRAYAKDKHKTYKSTPSAIFQSSANSSMIKRPSHKAA